MKMTSADPRIRSRLLAGLILLSLILGFPLPLRSQGNPTADFYRQLTEARLKQGLAPLSRSTLLDQAADRHARDLAGRGVVSSTGTDGSTFRQRIREAGYKAWNDGLLVNEVIWTGSGGAENALNWFRQDSRQWAMFMDPKYREIGLGHALDAQGMHYFVITVGSRPGVLPVFINDGAEAADSPQVAIRFTNEEAVPLGEGNWMGKAIEVRLSSSPDFDDAPWQPWSSLQPWVLEADEPGEYAVYVEFRDGAKRTAVAQDTIRLTAGGEPRATLPPDNTTTTPEASPTLTPTQTPTPFPTPTAMVPPTVEPAQPSAAPSPVATLEPPTATPPPFPTATPTPAPQPTWTPLPSMQLETSDPPDWPLLAVFGLQALALILGGALFLRRR